MHQVGLTGHSVSDDLSQAEGPAMQYWHKGQKAQNSSGSCLVPSQSGFFSFPGVEAMRDGAVSNSQLGSKLKTGCTCFHVD